MNASLRFLRTFGPPVGLSLALLGTPLAFAAEGLAVTASGAGPRWQARLNIDEVSLPRWAQSESPDLATPVRAALLGDYDLGTFGLALPAGATGRFRATSGLLFGLRSSPGGGSAMSLISTSGPTDNTLPSTPYVGLGYTGWLAKTGLSFSADVGVMADYPGGNWRFGRTLFGSQGADAAFRELRLQPRLQLGVQYTY